MTANVEQPAVGEIVRLGVAELVPKHAMDVGLSQKQRDITLDPCLLGLRAPTTGGERRLLQGQRVGVALAGYA